MGVDGAQLRAASLDIKCAVVADGRGVALAQDDQVALGAAQVVGHAHQVGQDALGVWHRSGSRIARLAARHHLALGADLFAVAAGAVSGQRVRSQAHLLAHGGQERA